MKKGEFQIGIDANKRQQEFQVVEPIDPVKSLEAFDFAQYKLGTALANPAVQKVFDFGSRLGLDYNLVVKLIGSTIIEPKTISTDEIRKNWRGIKLDRWVDITWEEIAEFGVQKSYGIFLDIAFIEINREKDIVRTPVPGRVGTIKEYNYTDDYSISIKGSLVAEKGKVPFARQDSDNPDVQTLEQLIQLQNFNGVVNIESKILNAVGIFQMVITSIRFNEHPEYRNVVDFEISAYSDSDEDLLIQKLTD